jgi:hypothetical protein
MWAVRERKVVVPGEEERRTEDRRGLLARRESLHAGVGMKRLVGMSRALEMHMAISLANECDGRVSSRLVSEEDVELIVEFVAEEQIDLGSTVVQPGEQLRVTYPLHVSGMVSPEIEQRFDLPGSP